MLEFNLYFDDEAKKQEFLFFWRTILTDNARKEREKIKSYHAMILNELNLGNSNVDIKKMSTGFTERVFLSAKEEALFLIGQNLLPGSLAPKEDTPPKPLNEEPETPPANLTLVPETEAIASPGGWAWSSEQDAIFGAVASPGSNVVRARAGCGKTTTAIEALDRYQKKFPSHRLLFVSFANKITKEAQEKIGERGIACDVLTYHKLGNTLCKTLRGSRLERQRSGDRQSDILQQVLDSRIDKKLYFYIANLIDKCRNTGPNLKSPDEIMSFGFKYQVLRPDISEKDCAFICNAVSKGLEWARKNYSIYDVHDMIFLPNVLGLKLQIYDFIVVDECQDTSPSFLQIAKNCMKPTAKMLAIGDDKQAIYEWLGADSLALDTIKRDMKANEFKLTATRRCPVGIARLVQGWVPDFVSACKVQANILDIRKEQVSKYAKEGSFILSRTNAPLVPIMFNLLKNKIPAKIYGKDIGEKLVKNCRDIIKRHSLNSISQFIEHVNRDAIERMKAIEWLKKKNEVLHDKLIDGIKEEKDFLISFFEQEKDSDLEFCMNRIESLFTDDKGNFVILSSVHKIKGLESDSVILLGETFKKTSPEEKNILYVAITRSKRELLFVDKRVTLEENEE